MIAANKYDYIIAGAGIMGASTAWALAKRGKRVLVLDKYGPDNPLSASRDETRMHREWGYVQDKAIYEEATGISAALFRMAEQEIGQRFFFQTGVQHIVEPTEAETISTIIKSYAEHQLPAEINSGEALKKRYPAFNVPDDYLGIVDPMGGYFLATKATQAIRDLATKHGATFQYDEAVTGYEKTNEGIIVNTTRMGNAQGAGYAADKLIRCMGAWLPTIEPAYQAALTPVRMVAGWFAPEASLFENFTSDNFGPFVIKKKDHNYFFGFPIIKDGIPGVKFAVHEHLNERIDVTNDARTLKAGDETFLREAMHGVVKLDGAKMIMWAVCQYIMSRRERFGVGSYPEAEIKHAASNPDPKQDEKVFDLIACDGHAFKLGPFVGEEVAHFVEEGVFKNPRLMLPHNLRHLLQLRPEL